MINSWTKKSSWRLKKKKTSNCAYLLQKKKGKSTARVQRRAQLGFAGVAVWWKPRLQAAGAKLWALGLQLLPWSGWSKGAVATGTAPLELPACCSASSQGVCFLLCACVWQLPAAVIPSDRFPKWLEDRVRALQHSWWSWRLIFPVAVEDYRSLSEGRSGSAASSCPSWG